MRLLLAPLALSGCSLIFMERAPESHISGSPVHCTASKGFIAWDAVLAVANAATLIAILSSEIESKGAAVAGTGGLALGHLLSGFSGNGWANDCAEARTAERQVVVLPASQPRVIAKPERKVVEGDRPLFCAAESADVGLCFLSEGACAADVASRAAGASQTCERRGAGACFTATRVLDETKSTTCAVSIKDCEARRTEKATDADLRVTPCGVYRVRQ